MNMKIKINSIAIFSAAFIAMCIVPPDASAAGGEGGGLKTAVVDSGAGTEYELMSLLVSSEYLPEFELILINPSTEKWCLSERLDKLLSKWPELKRETMDSLIVRNSCAPEMLEPKFDINAKTVLVSENDFLKVLGEGSEADWDGFDKTFPDAQGYLTFSRPAFNAERTQALVIFSNAYRCSGTRRFPATRKIAFFEKSGSWRLVGVSKSFSTYE